MPSTLHFSTSRTIFALMLREMATTYGKTVGGYLWAILEPLAAIALLSFAFALAFRSPAIGTSFPLFYASGYLPFHLYTSLGKKISASITYSRQLLRYPGVTFVDAILARFLLNVLTQLVVIFLVLAGILVLLDVRTFLDIPSILLGLSMAAALGLGIGVLNCFLMTRFPVWQRVWTILNRPVLIASAVLYVFESAPKTARDLLWYNPLVHVVGAVRRGIFPTYDAAYVSAPYVFAIALITGTFGLLMLRKTHRDLINL